MFIDKVIENIECINEPIANSIWIDMREDIYRFFKEAINNIIIHVQPPYGNATEINITLKEEENLYYLIITNSGFDDEVKNNKKKEA